MQAKVLLVDDDEEILEVVGAVLEQQGFEVEQATSGKETLEKLEEIMPDLLILDVRLPDMDGLEVCRALRRKSLVPILMMTGVAKDEFDKVLGLEMGADDYLCKPFHLRELLARAKALIRRSREYRQQVPVFEDDLQVGELYLSPLRHEVRLRGKPIKLTPKEFELCRYLMQQAGIALPRGALLRAIWGLDDSVTTRTLDVHIRRLRAKLEDDPAHPKLIQTISGVGYKLVPPESS